MLKFSSATAATINGAFIGKNKTKQIYKNISISNTTVYTYTVVHFLKLKILLTPLLFKGTCYFLPILGGALADSVLGKFNTIFSASLIYFIGRMINHFMNNF